jgi:alpha-ribazole phosphatase
LRLILVRHPRPLCPQGLCYGRTDLACDPAHRDEVAHSLREAAKGADVVSSPLRRAHDLARLLRADIEVDDRLSELNFGLWENRLWSDLGREAIDLWRAGLPNSAPPGGESLAAMIERCAEWLADISRRKSSILAISHAGPIRVIRALASGRPPLDLFASPFPYGGIQEIHIGG